jgi:hypothetical protein
MLGLAVWSCAGQGTGADQGVSPAATRGTDRLGNFELGITYTFKMAKIANTSSGAFNMQGGSADGVYWFNNTLRNFGVAFDFSTESKTNITPGLNLDQVSVVVGPRYNVFHSQGNGHLRPSVYAEELLGFVHAYDSVFPVPGSAMETTSSATSFALQTGAGVNLPISGGLGLRLFEVDYIMTHLPNNSDTYQGDFRASTGLDIHF